MTIWQTLVMLVVPVAGCASFGKMMGVGQPDDLVGDIPLVIANPPASTKDFGEGKPYSICDFTLITPTGVGRGNTWFGGLAAPAPAQGEVREYKVKPGVYKLKVTACGGASENDVQYRGATRYFAKAEMTIEIKQATQISVVAPGSGEPQLRPGYASTVVRTGRWIHRYTCGDGGYVCER